MAEKSIYFDIGANVGRWSLANLRAHSPDIIVAVEPSPGTFKALENHTKDHPQIVREQYAVCDSDKETITFYNSPVNTISTLNVDWLTDPSSRFHGTKYQEIQVPVISLDKLVEKHGVPSLIKVDVEGAEDICLKSLTTKVECVCFEFASELTDVAFRTADHLKSIGFERFYVQMKDEYTFRPLPSDYKTLEEVKKQFEGMVPKKEWGMVWCI